MTEMTASFGLDRLHSAGAVFVAVKVKWMNSVHLRELPNEQIWQLIEPFLMREGLDLPHDPEWRISSVGVFKTAMETLVDTIELYRPLSDKSFVIHPESDEVLGWEPTLAVIEAWRDLLQVETARYLTEVQFNQIQDQVKLRSGAKGKNLFQPIRVAVIGKPHGTDLKILVPLLGVGSLLKRANEVLRKLKGS